MGWRAEQAGDPALGGAGGYRSGLNGEMSLSPPPWIRPPERFGAHPPPPRRGENNENVAAESHFSLTYHSLASSTEVRLSWEGNIMPQSAGISADLMTISRNRRGSVIPNHKDPSIPREYESWLTWEVGLPLTAPLLVLVLLCFDYWIVPTLGRGGSEAMIAVSGSGDFLLIAALLLFNISSKVQFVKGHVVSQQVVKRSDRQSHAALIVGVIFLIVYMIFRFIFAIQASQSLIPIEFLFGVGSAIALFMVVIWSNTMLCEFYLRSIQYELQHIATIRQYER